MVDNGNKWAFFIGFVLLFELLFTVKIDLSHKIAISTIWRFFWNTLLGKDTAFLSLFYVGVLITFTNLAQ